MLEYQVQKGDTIAAITRRFNTNWATLRKNNPDAIGRSTKNGNWFLKEGATVNLKNSFQKSLQQAEQQQTSGLADTQPISIPRTHHKIMLMAEKLPETSQQQPAQKQETAQGQ